MACFARRQPLSQPAKLRYDHTHTAGRMFATSLDSVVTPIDCSLFLGVRRFWVMANGIPKVGLKGYASGLDALSFHELACFRIPSCGLRGLAIDVGAKIGLRILRFCGCR
jgi:hypothetical protein